MPSHHSSHFQPPPPIRTATGGSQPLGTASPDMLSPTSAYSRGPHSPTSPAEDSFFGALTSRLRGRSHSRSRTGASRKRSKSPMMMPPEHFPPSSSTQPISPTYASPRPRQSRHISTASQSSMASMSSKAARPSLQGPSRRSTSSSTSSDMWRGRHSNSWLFNDFSVTEHAKDILHLGRKS